VAWKVSDKGVERHVVLDASRTSGSPPVMRIYGCEAEEDPGETVELGPGENFVVIA